MKKKLVIIGGGFAGSAVAKALEKVFDTTLIDSKNYFEYTPGILRTIVEPGHIRKIQVLHAHYLKRSKIIKDCVTRISEKHVFLGKKRIPYDYLVIASGSLYGRPIKEQNVVISSRASTLRSYYKKLCEAKRVIVIGGGIVGVEMAAEIIEHYPDKKIILVHSRDELMPRSNKKSRAYAEKFLKKRGVEILFNERVIGGKGKTYTTKRGTKIKADLAFMCTGIKPNSQFMKGKFSKCLDDRKFIKVNDYLQLEGYSHIFAIGDCTGIREEKLAQTAEEHAKIAIKNLCAMEKHKSKTKYISKKRIVVISLGKYDGMIVKGNACIKGLPAAIGKAGIERVVVAQLKHL